MSEYKSFLVSFIAIREVVDLENLFERVRTVSIQIRITNSFWQTFMNSLDVIFLRALGRKNNLCLTRN